MINCKPQPNETENITYLRDLLGDEKVDHYKEFLKHEGTNNKNSINSDKDKESKIIYRDYEAVKTCLKAMSKYGIFHWWLSDNPYILGYYQVMEDVTLINYLTYSSSLSTLLGRDVWQELFNGSWPLRDEAESKFRAYLSNSDSITIE